jgi:hypothetical protein
MANVEYDDRPKKGNKPWRVRLQWKKVKYDERFESEREAQAWLENLKAALRYKKGRKGIGRNGNTNPGMRIEKIKQHSYVVVDCDRRNKKVWSLNKYGDQTAMLLAYGEWAKQRE